MALKLELEVNEINTILRVLGKHPFDEVAALVRKIQEQGSAQLAEETAAQTEAPAEETTAE